MAAVASWSVPFCWHVVCTADWPLRAVGDCDSSKDTVGGSARGMPGCASIVAEEGKNETEQPKLRVETDRRGHPAAAHLLHRDQVRRLRRSRVRATTGAAVHQPLYQEPGN